MTILANISTHIIKKEENSINVYIKTIEDIDTMAVTEKYAYSLAHADDVLCHIEDLKETNRILRNEGI